MILWPSSLPAMPTKNYTEDAGVLILRTPMDAGPAKQRRRGKRPSNITLQYEMTAAQVTIFSAFVEDTLMGIKRYQISHPRTNLPVEIRIIPQQDGKLYDIVYATIDLWLVSLNAEILP